MIIFLSLSKDSVISWCLKSTTANTFTMRNNRGKLPGYAPVPPYLMNIYSEKVVGKKSGEILPECLKATRGGLNANFHISC